MRLDRLSAAMAARYNSAQARVVRRRNCTLNTRMKVRKELRDWANKIDSPKVYWLNGMAGTGKTTIAYSLCDELERDCQLGASFFCSRLLPECRDLNRLIPTIAYQLASFSPSFRSALCDALADDRDLSTYDISTQFNKLIRKPLLVVNEAMPGNVVVGIDALDELSNSNDARLVLDILFRYAAELPIMFLVTSRPEPGVRDKMLSGGDQFRSILYLHDIERSLVQADIKTYLQVELQAIAPSPNQVQRLTERAGNLFIYAATAVRYILLDSSSADPLGRLEAMLQITSDPSSRKHKDIDTLYMVVLEAALEHPDLEPKEVDNIRLVLHTAVCSREPITAKSMASLLKTDESKVLLALQSLRSVLHVSETSGLISTLHASFPDYMLSIDRSGRFFCDEKQHNQVLAQCCFDVMRGSLRFNICDLESSHIFDRDVQDLSDRVNQSILPQLFYACRYWGNHLQGTTSSDVLRASLNGFLSTQLLFWMEVLNLKHSIGIGGEILLEAHRWLEVSIFGTKMAKEH
jgi:hypothetical protein